MGRHRRGALWIGLAIAGAAMGAAATGGTLAQDPTPTPPAGCLPAPPTDPDAPRAVNRDTVTDTAGNPLRVVEVSTGLDPAGIAVDATDAWGRVFVADRGSDQVTILYGRSPALTVACRYPVAGGPFDVAVDDATGTVLVTLSGTPSIGLLDGRTDPPVPIGSVQLPDMPSHVTLDQDGRRAWVTLPETGQVALLEPATSDPSGATWSLTGTFDAGSYPTFLAVDPERQRLLVAAQGQAPDVQGAGGAGRILLFDTSVWPPAPIGSPIPASLPTGATFDPVTGTAYVLENGDDSVAWLTFPEDPGAAPAVQRLTLPYRDAGHNLNPVEVLLLPGSRELVVTMSSSVTSGVGGHLDVLRLDDAGGLTYDRSIPAAQRTRGIALDPTTGRLFVSEVTEGAVAGYIADEPSAPPPPPTAIAQSLPGPLSVSFAPADVVRTVGLSLLVLFLIGAPTPLFNETLETHLNEIQGWLGKRVPRRRRTGDAEPKPAARDRIQKWSTSIWGVAAYLLVAALLYSLLTPGFPGQDALLVFGVAIVGLIVATVADILPGDRYVLTRYRTHGTFRVAGWTLALAAVCVAISRMANLQPGYMYGIIGTFTFGLALTRHDEGSMEARGAVGLLILALLTWFARIPFEPTPGVPQTGPMLIINMALVSTFVVAVEGLVFGLIPIRFLPGQKIFAWSRWRWAVLWGAGIALFAHVLMYPVTLAQPSPDPATLATTLVSAGIYGAIAVGFWAAFRYRAARNEASGSEGEASATDPPDTAD